MISLLLSAVLLQGSAQVAYLTPEEVLLQDQVQYYGSDGTPLPINPRRAQQIVDEEAAARLAAASSGRSSVASSSSIGSSHYPLPPALDLHLQGDLMGPGDALEPDPQVLRLLERLENRETATVAASTFDPSIRRPLVPSGPEAVASVVAMGFAVVVTMLWARRTRGWKKSV